MQDALATTSLHQWHASHGGKMVDFAGWSMPVQYESIVTEHNACRNAAGLFDVSHMGRFRFAGAGTPAFIDSISTRCVTDLGEGRIRYSLVTNAEGGILDDVLIYHVAADSPYFFMVVNAGNRQKIWDWLQTHLAGVDDVSLVDETIETAMIAVQGPLGLEIAQSSVEQTLSELRYYRAQQTQVCGQTAMVSRTGYTGEDGVELIVPNAIASELWEKLLASGSERGVRAVGLGARDTLRLEAAMPLYGHELSEQINPFTAGLDFAVNLEGRDFVGRDALVAAAEQCDTARVGLEMAGRRVPREHYPIVVGEETIGEVTSGTFSPTLERPIAMGYVSKQYAADGTELGVSIRGRVEAAKVVSLPFYKR